MTILCRQEILTTDRDVNLNTVTPEFFHTHGCDISLRAETSMNGMCTKPRGGEGWRALPS